MAAPPEVAHGLRGNADIPGIEQGEHVATPEVGNLGNSQDEPGKHVAASVSIGAARHRAASGFRPTVGRNRFANPKIRHDAILRSALNGPEVSL